MTAIILEIPPEEAVETTEVVAGPEPEGYSEEVLAAIEEAKAEVDRIVSINGNGTRRDYAFIELGFVAPPVQGYKWTGNPELGYAMPIGTIIRTDDGAENWFVAVKEEAGNQWRIKAGSNPNWTGTTSSPFTNGVVIYAPPFTFPAYKSRDDVLMALWEKAVELRPRHAWCSAVENALTAKGWHPSQLVNGGVGGGLTRGGTYAADDVLLQAAPNGTIVRGRGDHRNYYRINGGWYSLDGTEYDQEDFEESIGGDFEVIHVANESDR